MKPSPTEAATPQSRCRFALAWADITPPPNIYHRMWGAAKHERATGVHRPLRATVAAFAAAQSVTSDVGSSGAIQFVIALVHCVLGAVEHETLDYLVRNTTSQPRMALIV